MNEDKELPEGELLDYLCWKYATDGERFFPPGETADECMESLPDDTYEDDSLEEAEARGWEHGQHSRAWTEAVQFFDDLERRGYDPVARAEREIKRSREQGLQDLPDIDLSWYNDS